MEGFEKHFWQILAIVFLAVDIVLFLSILKERDANSKTLIMLRERQGQVDRITNDFIEVDQCAIMNLLEDTSVGFESLPRLIMVIPSYPCSACLDRETELFRNFAETEQIKCGILTPDYRVKDVKALFFGIPNMSMYLYSRDILEDTYWAGAEEIIYFLMKENVITNIMVTSKYSESASEHYFEHIREMIQ